MLVLLLGLIAVQSQALMSETLGKQLLSVSECNAEQLLLPASDGGDDQPGDIALSSVSLTAPSLPGLVEVDSKPSLLFSTRWVAPSPRAPPTLS